MLQKFYVADLLIFYAIYEAQNADNARTLRNLMTNSMKSTQQTISPLSEGDSSVFS